MSPIASIADVYVTLVPESGRISAALKKELLSVDGDVKRAAQRWSREIDRELGKADAEAGRLAPGHVKRPGGLAARGGDRVITMRRSTPPTPPRPDRTTPTPIRPDRLTPPTTSKPHRPTRGLNPGHREILRHGIASDPPKPNENRQSALSRRGTVLLNARRR